MSSASRASSRSSTTSTSPEMQFDLTDLVPGAVLLDGWTVQKEAHQASLSSAWRITRPGPSGGGPEEQLLTVYPSWLFADRAQASAFAAQLEQVSGSQHAALHRTHEVVCTEEGTVLQRGAALHGRSLRAFLREGEHLSSAEGAALGAQVLAGLATLHGSGLVHGDLKPEHVFWDGDPEGAVVTAAGVTPALWSTQHLGARTQLVGTPYYAPLEQFSGDAPSPSSDVYNLATTVYEAVTGELPWTGRGFVEVFQSKMTPLEPMAAAARRAGLDPGLDAALRAALAPRRQDRPADAAAALEILQQLQAT